MRGCVRRRLCQGGEPYDGTEFAGAAVCAAVVIMALGGCSWGRQQINQADLESRVAGVVPGQTTAAELERLAGGPPTSITPVGQKQLYAYTFGELLRRARR